MSFYIDMDGVLVKQTGRESFDRMPWTKDGREFWALMARYRPILISTAGNGDEVRLYNEKRTWIDRNLGQNFRLYLMSDEIGKAIYSGSNHVLIDNDHKQEKPWAEKGGIFIIYKRATQAIADMMIKGLL